MRAALDQLGQAGIGLARGQTFPVFRQPFDMLGHLLRAGGAIESDQRHVQRIDHGGSGGDVGADQQRAGGLDRDLDEDRRILACFGPRRLGGVDRRLDLQRVLAGLDQDGVHAARDQPLRLDDQPGFQRVVTDMAEARQLGARPHRADDEAFASVARKLLDRLARQLGRDLADLEGAVGQVVELAQRDRRAAEGVGFHHVRPGLQIAAMDLAHDVGPRQVQNLGAILLPPIVLFDIERHRLDTAARAAVAEQNTIGEGV